MKKEKWKALVKKAIAVMMMACTLLTVVAVSSDAGIMLSGEYHYDIDEL